MVWAAVIKSMLESLQFSTGEEFLCQNTGNAGTIWMIFCCGAGFWYSRVVTYVPGTGTRPFLFGRVFDATCAQVEHTAVLFSVVMPSMVGSVTGGCLQRNCS